jgi:hypothetical protein
MKLPNAKQMLLVTVLTVFGFVMSEACWWKTLALFVFLYAVTLVGINSTE